MATKDKTPWKSRRSLWLTRLGFLVLSAFLWLLLQLGDSMYTQEFTVPVQLEKTPRDRMLLQRPSAILIRSEAPGINALRQMWSEPDPITLDFDAFEEREDDVFILTDNAFQNEVGPQISSRVRWKLADDSLVIKTSSLQRKKIAIKAHLELSFEPPYFAQGQPIVTPDSIYVFGAPEIMDSLRVIHVPTFAADDVKDDVSYQWNPELPGELSSLTEVVEIVQRVNAFTEKWVEVPIRLPNQRRTWRPVPEHVRVRCRVPLESHDRLQGSMFKVVINKSEYGSALVPLKWEHIPDFVEVLDWQPHYFEIIESND